MYYSIIKGKTSEQMPFGISSTAKFTPYLLENIKTKEKYFIANLLTDIKGSWVYKNNNRLSIAQRLKNLRANNYRFFTEYAGKFKTPIELIEYAIKTGWTFQCFVSFFTTSISGNYTEFHGNIVEYSNAFSFRIYDKKYLADVKELFKKAKNDLKDRHDGSTLENSYE